MDHAFETPDIQHSSLLPWLDGLSPAAAAMYGVLAASAKNYRADSAAVGQLLLDDSTLDRGWRELHEKALLVRIDDPQQQPRVLLSKWATSGQVMAAHDGYFAVYDDELTASEIQQACSSLESCRQYIRFGRNVLHGADPVRLTPTNLDWTRGFGEGGESAFSGYLADKLIERDVARGYAIRLPDFWILERHLGAVMASIGPDPAAVLPEIDRQLAEGDLEFAL